MPPDLKPFVYFFFYSPSITNLLKLFDNFSKWFEKKSRRILKYLVYNWNGRQMKCPIDFLVSNVIKGLLKPESGIFLTVCYVDFQIHCQWGSFSCWPGCQLMDFVRCQTASITWYWKKNDDFESSAKFALRVLLPNKEAISLGLQF